MGIFSDRVRVVSYGIQPSRLEERADRAVLVYSRKVHQYIGNLFLAPVPDEGMLIRVVTSRSSGKTFSMTQAAYRSIKPEVAMSGHGSTQTSEQGRFWPFQAYFPTSSRIPKMASISRRHLCCFN
jgi:hypothetical protein